MEMICEILSVGTELLMGQIANTDAQYISRRLSELGVNIISAMGAAGKTGTDFKAADLAKTSVCPLARVMRTELKKRGIYKLKVVYSKEQPLKPLEDIPKEAGGKLRGTPGSVSFVPPVVGYIMAGEIIRDVSDFSKKSNNKA